MHLVVGAQSFCTELVRLSRLAVSLTTSLDCCSALLSEVNLGVGLTETDTWLCGIELLGLVSTHWTFTPHLHWLLPLLINTRWANWWHWNWLVYFSCSFECEYVLLTSSYDHKVKSLYRSVCDLSDYCWMHEFTPGFQMDVISQGSVFTYFSLNEKN